jgi:hypothetical protein
MKETELQCKYDLRYSFYKKAILKEENNKIVLKSYNTDVAEYDQTTNSLKVFGWFSMTTARHINEFLQQMGFDKLTKSEMMEKPLIKGN